MRSLAALAFIPLLIPLAGCGQQQGAAATQPSKAAKPAQQPKAPAKAAVRPAPVPVPEPPKPLPQAPEIVRGVYLTSWSLGLKSRIDYVIDLAKKTGINAVVVDVKDYSGYIAYRIAVPEAQKYEAIRVTVRDLDAVIRRLHDAGIYVIARITVFQDPILARARPDLAVHRVSLLKDGKAMDASTLWLDRKGLAWIDPAAKPAWDYIVAIARDARAHGFDELNFDYIRFPSDGNLKDMHFPVWDGKSPKHDTIRSFFAYLRRELKGIPISADLFGLATVNNDDLGIGQVIEDAYVNFDYVCPMVYPSHFARGFRNFPNPAEHPYEVLQYSMGKAVDRLRNLRDPKPEPLAAANGNSGGVAAGGKAADGVPSRPRAAYTGPLAKLRPWIQDFHLGAKYDAARVRAQIRATRQVLGGDYAGYLVWAPSNVYTAAALIETPEAEAEAGAAN